MTRGPYDYYVNFQGLVHYVPYRAVEVGLKHHRYKYLPPSAMTLCNLVVLLDTLMTEGTLTCLFCVVKVSKFPR